MPSKIVKQRKSKATVKNSLVDSEGVFIDSTDDNRQSKTTTEVTEKSLNIFGYLPKIFGNDERRAPRTGQS